MKPIRFALAAVVSVALAGCATLGSDSLAVYGVSRQAQPEPRPQHLALQILVEAPHAADPLLGTRIALRTQDGEYAVLPGARWREPSTELFRTLLVESLERSGVVSGVARTSTALAGDILLEPELRQFELVRGSATRAVAQASITVVRVRDGRSLGTFRVSAEAALERNDTPAAVQALGAVMNDIVSQAERELLELLGGESLR